MDKYLDTRFNRVEKALATFIDSIAKYNPSEKLAEDLVAADRELAAGLKELERHQNNHARILQLRQETASLDQQTKDIIGGLWNMRKEVKTTPATSYPSTGAKYKFTTYELLNYAKRISRTTLPPTHLIVESNNNNESQQQVPSQGQPMDLDSAAPTPMPGTATAAGTPAASAAPTPAASGPGAVTTSSGTTAPFSQQLPQPPSANQTALPEDFKPHINLLTGFQFHPWPTEDKVRMGGMAAYQSLISRAVDPKGYDPEEEERRKKEEEEARKEAEERAIREREEEEKRMREERERMARERERARREEAERSGSISGPSGAASAPGAPATSAGGGGGRSQFTFLDGMDDDDDDED